MNLNINTGEIALTVNNDPERVIRFNPNSIEFAEAFCGLTDKLDALRDKYNEDIKRLDADMETDEYGRPKNIKERLKLIREICDELKREVDEIFGAGASKTVFGNVSSFEMFEDFFNGISPYVRKAREDKIKKYTGNRAQRRAVLK